MKKVLIIVAGLALMVLAGAGCRKQEQSSKTPGTPADTTLKAPAVQTTGAVYYCPMDTDVVSDKPGKCSKCGMDLVLKPAGSK